MMQPNTTWEISLQSPLQAVVEDASAPELLTFPLRQFIPWQVRNETEVAQVVAAPQLAAPWVAALIALGAEVSDGERTLPLAEAMYRRHPWQTLRVPNDGWTAGSDYVARAPTDEPIVYAAAAVWVDEGVLRGIRVALTGVSRLAVYVPESPARWVGQPFNDETIQAIAQAVAEEVRPHGDFRGSEEYRRAMAEVLTRRAMKVGK
ncbi:MAG: hypothetical protein GXO55_06850 [Chloroflexi bacterium]|nr:hypothetical protein [Chloroflexota bacterium]